MTRATKLSGILSGAFATIVWVVTLAATEPDWSNVNDVILSGLVLLLFVAGPLFLVVWKYYSSPLPASRQPEQLYGPPKTAKQDGSAGGIGALLVIGFGVYGIYAIDWGFSKGQITDYTLVCSKYDHINNRCNGSYVKGPATTYTVNADQQFVVSQTEGEPPARMSKCAIVDRKNWKCNAPEGGDSISVAYADGEYRGMLVTPFYKHVARYDWIWADKASGR